MDRNYLVPPVGTEGYFKIDGVFKDTMNQNVKYEVKAVETISRLLDDEIDVFNLYYRAQGLSKEDYIVDKRNDMVIITLMSEGNNYFYIPARLLLQVPNSEGVKFKKRAITLDLGFIPAKYDLDFISREVADLVRDLTGLNVSYSEVDLSGEFLLSYEENTAFEVARTAKINKHETCLGRLRLALETLEKYKKKVKVLVEKIEKDN